MQPESEVRIPQEQRDSGGMGPRAGLHDPATEAGMQKVEITLQFWEYSRTDVVEVPRTLHGLQAMRRAVQLVHDRALEESVQRADDTPGVRLVGADGESSMLCTEGNADAIGLDWLMGICVSARILSTQPTRYH